ncbi:MAG: hypothetical protein KDE58_27345 [Caldilineaceae bacterium]|nr:hypothetical protein [Caldilineaceae bacterium]
MSSEQQQLWLWFQLESDATFGRGDGIPGLVDREVTVDANGCPYLHGRTLKGLLGEVCADILFALDHAQPWKAAADHLFGVPGSGYQQGILHIGHAQLPIALRSTIQHTKGWTAQDVIESLTTVRRQTAIDISGAPDPRTLRSMRVILRKTYFEAELTIMQQMDANEKALLAACVKGLRRAGTARNRGRGRLHAWIEDANNQKVCNSWFDEFKQKVGVA